MESDKQRILNVDGHGVSTEMVKLFFETQSVGVIIAKKTAERYALATSGRFDLNILGATFTDGPGVELGKRIRAFDLQIPLVFFSAKALQADVREAIGVV